MNILKKILPYFLLAGVILLAGYVVYQYGYKSGSEAVQARWDEDKAKAQAAYVELAVKMAKQEEQHRMVQQEIADELAHAREDHAVAIDRLRADFDQRLLQSNRRAAMYQRQAQAGAVAQRDLASHAARLDRALEEGIGLVEELTRTLELREHQLILLGAQIRNDRQVLEGPTP